MHVPMPGRRDRSDEPHNFPKLGSRLTFSRVAYGKHHMSAGLRECPRGGQPDAAVSTSDDEDAPSLRWQVGSGPAS
jgi:hypothetical protein